MPDIADNVRASYRADQVGSFLRPQTVKDAHAAYTQGQLPLDELRAIEDRAILEVLELQKQVGVDVFSDGEFRRGGWSGDFVDAVDGYVSGAPAVSVFNTARGNNPAAQPGGPPRRIIGARLRQKQRLTQHEAAFLAAHAPGPCKMTMPAASYVLARGYRPDITDPVYGSRAAALHDVATIIRSEITALIDDGIAYVQLDNPHYPDYVVEERNAQWRAVGVDPVQALQEDIAADNLTLDQARRDNVVLAMHLCRGNGGRGPDQPPAGTPPAATTPSPSKSSAGCTSTASCSSTTASAPAASSHSALYRPARRWCWAWSPPNPASWNRKISCCGASRKPPVTCRWKIWP